MKVVVAIALLALATAYEEGEIDEVAPNFDNQEGSFFSPLSLLKETLTSAIHGYNTMVNTTAQLLQAKQLNCSKSQLTKSIDALKAIDNSNKQILKDTEQAVRTSTSLSREDKEKLTAIHAAAEISRGTFKVYFDRLGQDIQDDQQTDPIDELAALFD